MQTTGHEIRNHAIAVEETITHQTLANSGSLSVGSVTRKDTLLVSARVASLLPEYHKKSRGSHKSKDGIRKVHDSPEGTAKLTTCYTQGRNIRTAHSLPSLQWQQTLHKSEIGITAVDDRDTSWYRSRCLIDVRITIQLTNSSQTTRCRVTHWSWLRTLESS